jgi:hypothetical protein
MACVSRFDCGSRGSRYFLRRPTALNNCFSCIELSLRFRQIIRSSACSIHSGMRRFDSIASCFRGSRYFLRRPAALDNCFSFSELSLRFRQIIRSSACSIHSGLRSFDSIVSCFRNCRICTLLRFVREFFLVALTGGRRLMR